jgi:hypothetical protein
LEDERDSNTAIRRTNNASVPFVRLVREHKLNPASQIREPRVAGSTVLRTRASYSGAAEKDVQQKKAPACRKQTSAFHNSREDDHFFFRFTSPINRYV